MSEGKVMVYSMHNGTGGFGKTEPRLMGAFSIDETIAMGALPESSPCALQDGLSWKFYRAMLPIAPKPPVPTAKAKRLATGIVPGEAKTLHIRGIPSGEEKAALIPMLRAMDGETVRWDWKVPTPSVTLSKDGLALFGEDHPGKRPLTFDESVTYCKTLRDMARRMKAHGIHLPCEAKTLEFAARRLRRVMQETLDSVLREESTFALWLSDASAKRSVGLPMQSLPYQVTDGANMLARDVAHELQAMLDKASMKAPISDEEKARNARAKDNTNLARETPYHHERKTVVAKTGCSHTQKARDDSHGASQNWMRGR
jgi:hypothetical protein